MDHKTKPQRGAQSIRRMITILRSVSRLHENCARLSGIAKDVQLPAPSVHRILTVLTEEGLLAFDPETKQYELGAELYSLGAATNQFSIMERYHGALKRICQQTDDATYLLVRSGFDVLCVDRVVGKFKVQVLGFEIGERRVMGLGAGGQALLSFLPEQEQKEIIKANSSRYNKQFGIEPEELREWIRQTREKGYATSINKITSDSIGVGVPVYNTRGEVVAAISVAGIINRMAPERRSIVAKLILDEIQRVAPSPNSA